MKTLSQDNREIVAVIYNDGDDTCHRVGAYEFQKECTKITLYSEKGIYNDLQYIAVFYEGKLKYRVPAYMVEIEYSV